MQKIPKNKLKVFLAVFCIALMSFSGGAIYVKATASAPMVPNLYLDDTPATADFVLKTDNAGWYWAVNSVGKIAVSPSTSASSILNSALTSLPSGRLSKGVVLLKGDFTFSSSVSVPSNTKIIVEGSITLANSFSSSEIRFFQILNAANVEITGGDWNGNGANQAANNEYISGIYVSNSHDITLTNMVIHDWGSSKTYGWGINAGYGSQRITIDHITGYNNGNEVIALNDASDSIATNLLLYNNAKFDAGANGIWINSNNITVSHVVGYGHKWGTVRVEANDKDRHGIHLSDIVTYGNYKIGISIDKTAVGNWHLYDVSLTDFSVQNTYSFEGLFIWGQSFGQVYDITVSNGHIYNTYADSGVYLYNICNSTISNVDVKNSYGNGIGAVGCENIQIFGGTLDHNGLSGLYYDSDITFSSTSDSKVIGSTLTSSPAYGFREDSACFKNIVSDVITRGNGVGIMILPTSGSHVLNSYNNTVWVYSSDVYNGIGHTSSATSVAITFPHDLGYTPAMIYITMADFGYSYYWVTGISSTGFTLNVQTSGTYYFLWEAR